MHYNSTTLICYTNDRSPLRSTSYNPDWADPEQVSTLMLADMVKCCYLHSGEKWNLTNGDCYLQRSAAILLSTIDYRILKGLKANKLSEANVCIQNRCNTFSNHFLRSKSCTISTILPFTNPIDWILPLDRNIPSNNSRYTIFTAGPKRQTLC